MTSRLRKAFRNCKTSAREDLARHISKLVKVVLHRRNHLIISLIYPTKLQSVHREQARKMIMPMSTKHFKGMGEGLLHDCVSRTSAPLRHCPLNVLSWHLDAAALAVHTVLRIYDDASLSSSCLICLWIFIHSSRTEPLFRTSVFSYGQFYDADGLGLWGKYVL